MLVHDGHSIPEVWIPSSTMSVSVLWSGDETETIELSEILASWPDSLIRKTCLLFSLFGLARCPARKAHKTVDICKTPLLPSASRGARVGHPRVP